MTISATTWRSDETPAEALASLPRSGPHETVAGPMAAAVLRAMRAAGGNAEAAAWDVGIEPGSLDEPDQRVPLNKYYDLWDQAVSRTGDSLLPLAATRTAGPSSLQLLGFAASTQRDLGAALATLAQFHALWSTGEPLAYEWGPLPAVALRQPDSRGRGREHAALFTLAKLLSDARHMTGRRDLAPLLVRLPRPLRTDGPQLEAFFGCPIAYGCQQAELVFRSETTELPLPKADPAMSTFFAEQARRAIADLAPTDQFVDRVIRTIREAIDERDPSMTRVAKQLGCSPRTLRRQLSRRGTGYRELLDEVRRELACVYLRRTELPLSQVTELLGFSEQSNFQRAFKRWTDTTPDRYRRSAS